MNIERETDVIQPQPSECKTGSYFRAMEFLRKAIEENAHLKQPRGISEQTWIRQRNLIGLYWGTSTTEKTLGGLYHISESRVTQIVKKGLLHLWRNCSEETQKQFPQAEIKAFRKPHGIPLAITRRVEAGTTDEELIGEFGAGNIPLIREVLNKLGVNIPLISESRRRRQELKDTLRSWWVLQTRADLKMETRPKIEKICGSKDTVMPNTTQLQNGERYRPIGHFLDKLNIDRRHQRGYRELILGLVVKKPESCPVPIFKYRDGFYYPVALEPKLKNFLRTQLEATS